MNSQFHLYHFVARCVDALKRSLMQIPESPSTHKNTFNFIILFKITFLPIHTTFLHHLGNSRAYNIKYLYVGKAGWILFIVSDL